MRWDRFVEPHTTYMTYMTYKEMRASEATVAYLSVPLREAAYRFCAKEYFG